MNEMNQPDIKSKLRKEMLMQRNSLSPDEKERMDAWVLHKLHRIVRQRLPQTVHCYLPMGSEVDISPLIESLLEDGIQVVTPKSLPQRKLEHLVLKSTNELEDGIFGTRHPAGGHVFEGSYDLIIVPGLAFTAEGLRLGYGGGYYDTFLKDQASAYKIGVAYPFQLLDEIPVEEHDVDLDEVVF